MNKFRNNVSNSFHRQILLWNRKYLIQSKSKRLLTCGRVKFSVILIRSYFRHGGTPDQVIELLSENYMAIARTATLIEKHFELEKRIVSSKQDE